MANLSGLPRLYPKETAAVIRRVLKRAFPACRFSVTTARGSMVSSVDIRWTDGPTPARVDALVKGFQSGHFDGMTDSFQQYTDQLVEVDGARYVPGCKYVFTHWEVSPRFTLRAARAVVAYNWTMRAEDEARIRALVTALEHETTEKGLRTFWNDGATRTIHPGNGVRDFGALVWLACQDRTTVTHTLRDESPTPTTERR